MWHPRQESPGAAPTSQVVKVRFQMCNASQRWLIVCAVEQIADGWVIGMICSLHNSSLFWHCPVSCGFQWSHCGLAVVVARDVIVLADKMVRLLVFLDDGVAHLFVPILQFVTREVFQDARPEGVTQHIGGGTQPVPGGDEHTHTHTVSAQWQKFSTRCVSENKCFMVTPHGESQWHLSREARPITHHADI